MEIFGWQFKKSQKEVDPSKTIDAPYVVPQNDDAAFVIGANYYGTHSYQLNVDPTFDSENDLIATYRACSLHPEVDSAINDIVNDAICGDSKSAPVEIVLDDLEQSDKIKETIRTEFDTILRLLKFNTEAYEIFRKWYVDARLHYHIIIDSNNTSNGIKELRYISPFNIKKVREEKRKIGQGGATEVIGYEEFYMYNMDKVDSKTLSGIKLSADSICYVTSGLVDDVKNIVYSHLHKALKPTNQLRMIEDALIIYRLSRAPERRIFYVDVGNLPKNKAEEYIRGIMSKHKNKMVYDAVTGEVKDSTNVMSMMEDIWMPRREGGRGTEVTTLAGGANLGEISDLEYFKKKVYQALNVPNSRNSETPSAFSIGRSSEMTRDEIRFQKFIDRLRKRFSKLFFQLLKTQLILKKIITPADWTLIEPNISFNFLSDSFFVELKQSEILKERLSTLKEISEYVGVYYSKEFVRRNVLMQTDTEIEQIDKQIQEEQSDKALIAKVESDREESQ